MKGDMQALLVLQVRRRGGVAVASPAPIIVLIVWVASVLPPDAKRIFVPTGDPGTTARFSALDKWIPFVPIVPVRVLVLLLGFTGIPIIVVASATL